MVDSQPFLTELRVRITRLTADLAQARTLIRSDTHTEEQRREVMRWVADAEATSARLEAEARRVDGTEAQWRRVEACVAALEMAVACAQVAIRKLVEVDPEEFPHDHRVEQSQGMLRLH
jgi:regulator of protease activity HflC (stomatin/prohibitin superfamily)